MADQRQEFYIEDVERVDVIHAPNRTLRSVRLEVTIEGRRAVIVFEGNVAQELAQKMPLPLRGGSAS